MAMITATIIGDWISTRDDRLTVVEWNFPRYILPEVNTYRQFSRSAMSSRAMPLLDIPLKNGEVKPGRITKIREDPWIPIHWGKNQAGMVAEEEVSLEEQIEAESVWREAANAAADYATYLAKMKIHKQVASRVIEPFSMHLHVVASTDWGNMFRQRIHKDAAPEFQALGQAHKDALDASTPKLLQDGEWALPYIRDDEEYMDVEILKKLSVSRVAKSSYGNAGKADIEADLQLFERLYWANPMHSAPFEMVATPTGDVDTLGNFRGFKQLRHIVESERMISDNEGLQQL